MALERRDVLKGFTFAGAAVLPALAGAAQAGGTPAVAVAGTPAGPAGSGAMPVERQLRAFRRMFAGAGDETAVCWYLGTMFVRVDGVTDVPTVQAEALMAYRATTTGPSTYRVDWVEIGYFRDPVSGGPAKAWLNPFTGRTQQPPSRLYSAPSSYDVSAGPQGVVVGLNQQGATTLGVETTLAEREGRIHLRQVERKVRTQAASTPQGGVVTMPPSVTTLELWSDAAAIDDPAQPVAAASGSYSFDTPALFDWFGMPAGLKGSTTVRGIMRKAATTDALNPPAWKALREAWPDWFDARGFVPRW